MPIVAINDDGTVDIARKSGKDRITVQPSELGKYNPSLIADYNEAIKAQKELKGEPQLTEAQQIKQQEAQDQLTNLESVAKEIKTMAESGKNVSGRFTGKGKESLAALREIIPVAPGGEFIERVDRLRSLASQLSAELAFGQGGKAFTETEKALIQGQIPELDVAETKNQNFLFNLLGIDPGKKGVTGSVLDTEEELINKMNVILEQIEKKRKTSKTSKFPTIGGYEIEQIE